jgi:hypothetical protein
MPLNITSLVARTNMATSPGGLRRNHCDAVSAGFPALGISGLAKSGRGSPGKFASLPSSWPRVANMSWDGKHYANSGYEFINGKFASLPRVTGH